MKSALIAVVLLCISTSGPVYACDLDDCSLTDASHRESPKYKALPTDEFAWMNHDLALARTWLSEGRKDKTIQIVAGLDYAIRVRVDTMVGVRGKNRVRALHAAIAELQIQAGGYPLAPLDLGGPRKRTEVAEKDKAEAPVPAVAVDAAPEPSPRGASTEAEEADRDRRDSPRRERDMDTDRREPPTREPAIRDLPQR